MATGGASLKLKRLRQRFGINAPKLAVRTHFPWYLRALAVVSMLAIMLALAAWIFEAGRRTASFQGSELVSENQELQERIAELTSELHALRDHKGSGESSLQIERATQQQLSAQIKALEEKNTALMQELAFFEGLISSSQSPDKAGLRIERLRVDPQASPGQYMFSILLVNSAGQTSKEARGTLELLLTVRQEGKNVIIRLPSKAAQESSEYRLEIKHYQRIEGFFSVPVGATLKTVEARVLQDGQLRARQMLTL